MKIAFVAVFATIAGYGVYTSQKSETFSDLTLANVEALAASREDSLCPNGCVDGAGGCSCNGIYVKTWKEYNWGNK